MNIKHFIFLFYIVIHTETRLTYTCIELDETEIPEFIRITIWHIRGQYRVHTQVLLKYSLEHV